MIAIDGPAGAGKSTVAKGVARALGLAHLDTGAMYRALTAKALAAGIDVTDEPSLARMARATRIDFEPGAMKVDGRPVGREIRSRRVSASVSAVSAHPAVRKELVRVQRQILRRGDVVVEGRDIGTVVFPSAPVKVFLTASIDERARRRHREMVEAGTSVSLPTLKREIARRDALDSTRVVSPLVPAFDAIVIDSTAKTARQVVAQIVAVTRRAREDAGPSGARSRR